jgi:TetR/AcrR family transcriptional regulator, ethionamide resistance regulator
LYNLSAQVYNPLAMASATKPSALSALRSQRRAELALARPDTRTALLQAAERQLAKTSLHELSVARILEEAQVSRASFYSYFESKFELAGALLGRVMDEMYELWRPYIERREEDDPQTVFRFALRDAVRLWSENRVIARVMHQYWNSVPEIGDHWLAAMERFTGGVAAELDRDRAAGLAPPGRDSRELAASALWATEQLLFVAGTGASADLPDEDAIVETLSILWWRLLYGSSPEFDRTHERER